MTLKAKALGVVIACVPAPTPLVAIFTGPSTEHKKQRWWMWGGFFFSFEGLSSVWLLFSNSLTQRSRFEVLLTADLQCFTRDDSCTFIPTVPRRRRVFTSWNIEVVESQQFCEQRGYFFHQAAPSQLSSPNQSPPPFPSPLLSTRRNHSLLDHRRHKSHRTYSSYQLVSHLETSTTLFPAIWTKTAGSIHELSSQWTRPKRASSDERLTKKTPRRYATTTTSVAWLWQMRRNEIEVGRTYMSLATGMVVFCEV